MANTETKQLVPHQERVVQEATELDEKIDKLGKFIVSDFFNSLSMIDQNLLKNQLIAMTSYSNILHSRIKRF